MTRLIRTEWLKMRKYPAFWWMLGILMLAYPGINYMLYNYGYKDALNSPDFGPILSMMTNPFAFPDVWQTVGFLSSLFIFLPSLLVIMFVTNEFTYKTHRQNIIDGWSRNDFLLSKVIDVLLVSVIITGLYLLTALVIGGLNSTDTHIGFLEGSRYAGAFFLQVFSQLSVALLTAFLVRKAFIALGIFLFYYFPLEPIIVEWSKHYANGFGEYLPLEISDRLLPPPHWVIRNDARWANYLHQANTHIFYTILLIGITWGVCFWVNKKRDL